VDVRDAFFEQLSHAQGTRERDTYRVATHIENQFPRRQRDENRAGRQRELARCFPFFFSLPPGTTGIPL